MFFSMSLDFGCNDSATRAVSVECSPLLFAKPSMGRVNLPDVLSQLDWVLRFSDVNQSLRLR